MKVLAVGQWERHFGYLGSCLLCQVTAVNVPGIGVCYVRENFRLHDSFTPSSSQRLGITGGIINGKVCPGIDPKKHSTIGRNILELCATPARWKAAASLIAAADGLHRPVLPNRNFTEAWARAHLPRFMETQLPDNAVTLGWSADQWKALKYSERHAIGDFRLTPIDPRLPGTQRAVHDLVANKTRTEISNLLAGYIGTDVSECVRKYNVRMLRRAGGINLTIVTPFEKILTRVHEWSEQLMNAGVRLEGLIREVEDAVTETKGPTPPPDLKVDWEEPLFDRLTEILDEYTDIGVDACRRAVIACYPISDGRKILLEMRDKISDAARLVQSGAARHSTLARLLGMPRSYFEESNLRKLDASRLQSLAHSLAVDPTVGAIRRRAAQRFEQMEQPREPITLSANPWSQI